MNTSLIPPPPSRRFDNSSRSSGSQELGLLQILSNCKLPPLGKLSNPVGGNPGKVPEHEIVNFLHSKNGIRRRQEIFNYANNNRFRPNDHGEMNRGEREKMEKGFSN